MQVMYCADKILITFFLHLNIKNSWIFFSQLLTALNKCGPITSTTLSNILITELAFSFWFCSTLQENLFSPLKWVTFPWHIYPGAISKSVLYFIKVCWDFIYCLQINLLKPWNINSWRKFFQGYFVVVILGSVSLQ